MNYIDRIVDEWKQDCVVTKQNIIDKSLEFFMLHSKYVEYYSEISEELINKEKELDELKLKKHLHFENPSHFTKDWLLENEWDLNPYQGLSKPKNLTDKDKFLRGDKQISDLTRDIEKLRNGKVIVDHILKLLNNPFILNQLLKIYNENNGLLA